MRLTKAKQSQTKHNQIDNYFDFIIGITIILHYFEWIKSHFRHFGIHFGNSWLFHSVNECIEYVLYVGKSDTA